MADLAGKQSTTWEQPSPILGLMRWTRDDELWLRSDVSAEQARRVVAHECRHLCRPDYNTYMDVQQSMNFRLMEEFEKAGLEFAYPTQQLFVTRSEAV